MQIKAYAEGLQGPCHTWSTSNSSTADSSTGARLVDKLTDSSTSIPIRRQNLSTNRDAVDESGFHLSTNRDVVDESGFHLSTNRAVVDEYF